LNANESGYFEFDEFCPLMNCAQNHDLSEENFTFLYDSILYV